MKQKYILGIFLIGIIAILGVGMVSAFWFGNGFGFKNSALTNEERLQMQEQHRAIQTAIENGDYTTWKSLMEERIDKMRQQLTEENFNKLRERHQKMSEFRIAMQEARELGDFSKVNELKKEFGSNGRGFGKGMRTCPFAE